MWSASRWLNLRTQFLGAVVTGLVALVVILQAHTIGSTIAGLTMVYALSFTDNVTFLARMHAECQMSLNSVERVMEYLVVDQENYLPDPNQLDRDDGIQENEAQSVDSSIVETIAGTAGVAGVTGVEGSDSIVDDEDVSMFSTLPPDNHAIEDTNSDMSQMLDVELLKETEHEHEHEHEQVQSTIASDVMYRRPSWEGPTVVINSTPRNWPQCGEVEFDRISLRYRPNTPLVLKYVCTYYAVPIMRI